MRVIFLLILIASNKAFASSSLIQLLDKPIEIIKELCFKALAKTLPLLYLIQFEGKLIKVSDLLTLKASAIASAPLSLIRWFLLKSIEVRVELFCKASDIALPLHLLCSLYLN